MVFIILLAAFVFLIFAPQLWIKYTLRKYGNELDDMPGTGGELANHLIERFELTGIAVEQTDEGKDHFDSANSMVRLSPSNYNGRSLKAVAIAAHEVGHAIQFHRQEDIFKLRAKYLPLVAQLRKVGSAILWLSPIVGLVFKSPMAMFMPIILSIGLQIIAALTYLIVLPEEWDASFGKALPILEEYLPESYMPHAQNVLKAAAFTYFAAALSSVLSLGYLLLILRR